ncbi:MAG: M1 family metallopeptidase [Bacteroidetes bacterium]|nr:M1 family metallopeptidase [Bacteroidota bacterium]MBL6943480.1 M1 family metallopeptidase [Bacteroidales bacterium]
MKKLIILTIILLIYRFGISQLPNQGIGDTIHAIHYVINLEEINTSDQTITGYTEIEIVSLVSNLDHIPLELLNLTTDSVFVNQNTATFSHDGNRLTINLNVSINVNDTVLVKIYYHGQPFHEDWGGFHFAGNYAFNLGVGFESIPHNLGKTWFPCIDNFTDRAIYDLVVTATTGLTVTGGGMLIDTINNGNNTTTWHWQILYPIPTYLASIALGNYIEYKDEYFGLEDTIPISIFTGPSDTGNVAGSFVNLHEIMDFFESRFGPYPFEKIGYTGTAIGAMEHASNIAYPHFAINGGTSYESLLTHELSHMWFGNKVTCSTAEDMWLNEGWATFCDVYYLDELYSHAEFITEMRNMHKDVLQNTHVVDGGYWALNNIPQVVTYGKTAYDKGGTVVNTLRNYLGDSIFFDAVTAYLNTDTIAYHSVSSYILRDFLTNYTGVNMTPFFDAWVMTPGTPQFSIDSMRVTEGGASFMIDIWLRQKYKGYDFLADDNIAEVTLVDQSFNLYTDTVHFSGKTGHSVKYFDMETMPSEPVAVFIDLFEKVNDATTDNYRYFTQTVEYTFPTTYFKLFIDELSDSTMIRVTHNWVAPDSLKVPVDGLRLSPYRYWKVEGVFHDSYQARGNFFYCSTSNLDDSLILSDNDSIVILYRENTFGDWHEVSQTRLGPWSIGNIMVDNLQSGEYTLAVWDKQIVGTRENKYESDNIKIYPNPSKGEINFEFPRRGNYSILLYDESGKQIDKFQINAKKCTWNWKKNNLTTRTVIAYISEKGIKLVTRKIVLIQ